MLAVLLLLLLPSVVLAQPFTANVQDYGAVGDGVTRDEAAIAAAVAAVAAHGGGVLLFPRGVYLSAPVNLTSDCEMRLQNATLLAAAEWSAWPIVAPLPSYGRGRDFPGPRYSAFIGVHNATRVSIVGEGGADANFINGQGASWWRGHENGSLVLTPGHLIETMWSSTFELSHVTLVDSPFWNTHLWSSSDIHVHDVKVRAPGDSDNTDGFDPDSSQNVLIERVDVSNGDDCIAIKSGWDAPGVAYGVPSRNITFRDSICDSPAGRGNCVAVGSEMSGGVADVFVSNITCVNSGSLLDVKSTLGRGGYVRNINVERCVITGRVQYALNARDDYGDSNGPVNRSLVPRIGGITVADVSAAPTATLAGAGFFEGLGAAPEQGEVYGVVLRNVQLGAPAKGWHCVNATGTSSAVTPEPCPQLQG